MLNRHIVTGTGTVGAGLVPHLQLRNIEDCFNSDLFMLCKTQLKTRSIFEAFMLLSANKEANNKNVLLYVR